MNKYKIGQKVYVKLNGRIKKGVIEYIGYIHGHIFYDLAPVGSDFIEKDVYSSWWECLFNVRKTRS